MIRAERKNEILSIVNQHINKTLSEIVWECNINLHTIDLTNIGIKDVSWLIFFVEWDWKFTILIHSWDTVTRKRFTLAHELWHYFLHEKIIRKEKQIIDTKSSILYRTSNNSWDEIEEEANFFAAELLMPKSQVIDLWWQITDPLERTTALARAFNVSEIAMVYRLTNLWLINE